MTGIKKISLLLFFLVSYSSFSQLVITEVYFDTPYTERYDWLKPIGLHHLGEFIEIYNYTTEDIPLKGWAISDHIGVYSFPDDAVIKSEGFLLLASRDNHMENGPGDYFPSFFPTTQGQEDKILYQENLLLRNQFEEVHINMGTIRGVDFDRPSISEIDWYFPIKIDSNESWYQEDPAEVDFYRESFQLGADGKYYKARATPLAADYVPPTQDIMDIPAFQKAILNNLSNFTWDYYSDALLNMTCTLVIPTVEQTPLGGYLDEFICFDYDPSGNTVATHICAEEDGDSDDGGSSPGDQYSPQEIDDISSKIIVYPNPTSGSITIEWEESVKGKIASIDVNNFGGVNIGSVTVTNTDVSASFDITPQPATIYIITFTLDTGQQISKNIIKQ